MPPGSDAAGSKRLAANGGRNRFCELSKNVLQRVLSFLPSREAVQTSLLSSQWRDIWKDARSLRITDAGDYRFADEQSFFVNMFLLFSNPRPLHVVDIRTYPCEPFNDTKESFRYIELWVRNCLRREAQILKVHNTTYEHWQLDQRLLSSKHEHLRVLDLSHVSINGVRNDRKIHCLDFSSCQALEDLMMNNCYIRATLIVSPSLKRLTLKCCDFRMLGRARISVPKLVFLILASCQGRTPILEKIPWLVSAYVRLQADLDRCNHKYETGDCNSCDLCRDCIIGRNTSVLLEALSGATHLELTSTQTEFLFRKDLTQCPLFSMLKTLLLNEWCVTWTLDALRCFLQHCPILEKLTIQFPKVHACSYKILEDLVDSGAIYNMVKEPILLKHLKVEVIRPNEAGLDIIQQVELDISICKILELLNSFGVPSEEIKIQQLPQLTELEDTYADIDDYNENDEPWPSARFSFEQQTTLGS